MSGLITDKDEDDRENHLNNGLDNNCRQAYFLAHCQLLAYIVGSCFVHKRQPSFSSLR
jgi:hypothetical protein